MRLVCKKCGFQLESNETKKVCSFCGEQNSLELVKEATELIEEFDL